MAFNLLKEWYKIPVDNTLSAIIRHHLLKKNANNGMKKMQCLYHAHCFLPAITAHCLHFIDAKFQTCRTWNLLVMMMMMQNDDAENLNILLTVKKTRKLDIYLFYEYCSICSAYELKLLSIVRKKFFSMTSNSGQYAESSLSLIKGNDGVK